ncbi:MAG: hypothetical protein M3R08_06350, partial [Bacteroidota bacterium]|nr:hypothetical protein [Bacteroidota bacterium]
MQYYRFHQRRTEDHAACQGLAGSSDLSRRMRHAFLITAYKDPDALVELIDDLGSGAAIHIHWDRRSPLTKEEFQRITSKKQVKTFSRRYKVNWGSTRHLRALLELSRKALLDPDVQRLHALSGSDRPIIPLRQFDVFFAEHEQSEFISGSPLPSANWQGGGLQRLTLYHPLDFLDVKRLNHARLRNLLLKLQRLFKVERSIKDLPPLHGGSTRSSISRGLLPHVLHLVDGDKK